MATIEASRCPRCKTPAHKEHCKSPTCYWNSCKKCVKKRGEEIIFDNKGHFFEWTVQD